MNRFSTTWSLMKSSFSILLEDKKLLLFPLFSGTCTLILGLTFILPVMMPDQIYFFSTPGPVPENLVFLLLFLFYYINYFVVIFFNSGAVLYTIRHIRGERPTIYGVFESLSGRLPHLLGWTAIAATVGIIINTIENQSDLAGRIVAGIIGLSWTVISFLVLPVMIIEQKGPIESLKESTAMLKRSWGEQLIGHFSFGLIFTILIIGAGILIVPLFYLGNLFSFAGLILLIIFGIILGIFQWILQSIFMGTLYLYVRDEGLPGSFSRTQIDRALK